MSMERRQNFQKQVTSRWGGELGNEYSSSNSLGGYVCSLINGNFEKSRTISFKTQFDPKFWSKNCGEKMHEQVKEFVK